MDMRDLEAQRNFRLVRNADMGPRVRAYFRLLSGRDAAEDGPEVEIIRAVLHGRQDSKQ